MATQSKKIEHLLSQQQDGIDTLSQLMGRYVAYTAMDAEVKQRLQILAEAERRHGEALHAWVTESQDVLLSVVDPVRTGSNPVSPRRTQWILLGSVLGLLTGLGIALLRQHYRDCIRAESDLGSVAGDFGILATLPRVRVPLEGQN